MNCIICDKPSKKKFCPECEREIAKRSKEIAWEIVSRRGIK